MPHRAGVIATFFSVFLVSSLCAANVDVPTLLLFTRGTPSSNTLELQTEGELDLAIEGGVKFGAYITLGFQSGNLEQELANRLYLGADQGSSLTFKSASVEIRELFSLPLTFSYFVGEYDEMISGVRFEELWGVPAFATEYRGFFYFADGIRYEGVHQVAGTGVRLAVEPIPQRLYVALYLYQDGYFFDQPAVDTVEFDPGHYSADIHSMLDLGPIKLEAFMGSTFPDSDLGIYRWGFLFHAADEGGEFLTQVGMPRWDPVNDSVNIDLFYLLFEARLYIGPVSIIPTVFLHPGYYLQNPTSEAGLLDFNFNVRVGRIERSLVIGGLETGFAFTEENLQELEIEVAPYVSFITQGVFWQIKAGTQVFPSIDFEAIVGIEAEL